MRLLDLSLETPWANVALDEALLEQAAEADEFEEVLRLWESHQTAVVVGRGSHVMEEVNVAFCQQQGIPIVRRCSGGAAIVAGPGCLMYGLVLDVRRNSRLAMIDSAHREILTRLAGALRDLGIEATPRGTSDLAVGDRKISGNSMRRKRHWILYHGTILNGLSPQSIADCLRIAPRQPAYRRGRSHAEFVTNVAHPVGELKRAISRAWQADAKLDRIPHGQVHELIALRYGRDEWNLGR